MSRCVVIYNLPVGKIAEKAVCRSVWHCILSVELTKTHSCRPFFWRFCPL